MFLTDTSRDIHCLNRYPVIQKLFLQYNNVLLSIAPLERLFSLGGQILTPICETGWLHHNSSASCSFVQINGCFVSDVLLLIALLFVIMCINVTNCVLTDSCHLANFRVFRTCKWCLQSGPNTKPVPILNSIKTCQRRYSNIWFQHKTSWCFGCQLMAKVPNAVEILPKIWTAWTGRTSVTDDRQTDRQTGDRK